jgi:NADPH:quinone reductase-like Zn-dependent oxidoreductase
MALDRLAGHLDGGTLRVTIQQHYRLEEAGAALASLPTTHTQGKLAIAIG